MKKFEINTSIISKTVPTFESAKIEAQKLSIKYGRASIYENHNRLAVYKHGIKVK